ncbi:MAG: AraC family transcriptional regulator [Nocardioidaceae bacterium]|nr:AraC family transcriptional regulator [Nocardioidaceae bacterium]
MEHLIRASVLDGFDQLVRDLGGDPHRLSTEAGLETALVGSPEAYLRFPAMARALDLAASELDCPDFALRLAARQTIRTLGPISLIALHSPTTRAGLLGIAEHMGNYTSALRIQLDAGPERTRFIFQVLAQLPSYARIYQLGLGVSLGVLRLLIGPGFRPLCVALPHDGLPAGSTYHDSYQEFFACPVHAGAAFTGFEISNQDLDRPRDRHDPDVLAYVMRYLDAEGPADRTTLAHVSHLIDRLLATGHATLAIVAAHLGVHPRTLQRWLATEETTFEALLDQARRDKALIYLRDSGVQIGHVARLLGYAQQSCLSRACVRWFGCSPRAVRSAAGKSHTQTG